MCSCIEESSPTLSFLVDDSAGDVDQHEETKKKTKKGGKSKPLPIRGWNELVQPLKEKASFWYFLWKENGKPRTKNIYHLAIRRVKRLNE